jgi:hypothetical protein
MCAEASRTLMLTVSMSDATSISRSSPDASFRLAADSLGSGWMRYVLPPIR